jgi:hypothetical protein
MIGGRRIDLKIFGAGVAPVRATFESGADILQIPLAVNDC